MTYKLAAYLLDEIRDIGGKSEEALEALRLGAALLRYCEEHRDQIEEYVNGELPE